MKTVIRYYHLKQLKIMYQVMSKELKNKAQVLAFRVHVSYVFSVTR